MKTIVADLLNVLVFKDVSVFGLVAISVALGFLAAVVIPVPVR